MSVFVRFFCRCLSYKNPAQSEEDTGWIVIVLMTIGTTQRRSWLRLVVHVRSRIQRVKLMARSAEIIPLALAGCGDADVVLPVDTGAQQPFVFRAMRFMAVRTCKRIVLAGILNIRGYGFARTTIGCLSFSVKISGWTPLDRGKGSVLGTINRDPVAVQAEGHVIRQIGAV